MSRASKTTLDKTYPIARPMFMYTPGTPPPHIDKYIDWILSDAGQKIVEKPATFRCRIAEENGPAK